ncbi:MAG: SRPBCC family protein [Hyphomicrobiales bacterium]|nr:MAG: SRPBCC family protein [Hyphomicrobiales bacterium]
MLASEVIKVSIDRPYAEVYEFLADPMNFARWATSPDGRMEPFGGGDWLVDLPRGRLVIRFAPRNNFGVLDYQVFAPGEPGGPVTPVRLIANGGGCELILVWMQRAGVPEEKFRSDAEWVASDLQRLKTLLEGG